MTICNCIHCAGKRREAGERTRVPASATPLVANTQARGEAIQKAAKCRNTLVDRVRRHLELVARIRENRCVTADDYEGFLRLIGSTHADLGNAAGAVFKHPAWEFTGVWTPSTRKTSNARYIRVWRLK